MSIGYATGTRGGSHHDTRPTLQYSGGDKRTQVEGQAEFAMRSQHFTAVGDSLTQCRFTSERGFGSPLNDNYPRLINAATGWDLSLEDVERIGERIYNLERAFNCREGASNDQDDLPYRVKFEGIPSGPSEGMYCPTEELQKMLQEYYRLRGWTDDGVPSEEKLSELGLDFVIGQL
jgi:aldehyde:ferredoxin oxidoreductase